MNEKNVLILDKIPREPLDKGDILYLKSKIEFYPGLTFLIGVNGSGKSTLLNMINREYEYKEDTLVLFYSDTRDGRNTALQMYLENGDISSLASSYCASEGEAIVNNVGGSFSRLGSFVGYKLHPDKVNISEFRKERYSKVKQIIMLIDGIDSGLSYDVIWDIRKTLDEIIHDTKMRIPNIPLYILVSSNTYELIEDGRCLDVRKMKYVNIPSYQAYVGFVKESRKAKERRLQAFQCRKMKQKHIQELKKKEREKDVLDKSKSTLHRRPFHW